MEEEEGEEEEEERRLKGAQLLAGRSKFTFSERIRSGLQDGESVKERGRSASGGK
jgi:hypothetical protein